MATPRFWKISYSLSQLEGTNYSHHITIIAPPRIFRPFYGPANQGPANRKYLASLTSAICIKFLKNLEESNLEPNI